MDLGESEKLMNFDEFMHQDRFRNTYVSEIGFLSLYVRKNVKRFIGDRFVADVIDIANVEATHPGEGNWTAFINRLREQYPDWTIFVENVLSARFIDKLVTQGFVVIEPITTPPCFYLPGGNFHKQVPWPVKP